MKKFISLVLCLSLLMSVAQLSAMADFVPTADEISTAGVATDYAEINETSTTETGSTSADKSATNADSTVNSETTVVANSNESAKGITKSGSAMLTATGDVRYPSECSFTIDAINVMDENANTILVYPKKLIELKNDTFNKPNLSAMFQDYTNWSNWTGVRIEKRGNETDGFRYTVIQVSDDCAGGELGVDKEDSFLLLVKNDYVYDKNGTQIIPIPNADWPVYHNGWNVNDYVSDGAGDTALIDLNSGNDITDIKISDGNSYGTVNFTRSRTFGIEAVNSFNNSANTILLYVGYWTGKGVQGSLGDIVEYEKINNSLDSTFNISDWAVVRIEKRGTTGNERYTCLQVDDPALSTMGYQKTDAYLLLIKREYIAANNIVLPTAAWDESDTTTFTADSGGETAKITFLGTDSTYSSNDSDGKKNKVNSFSYTGYYYSYVTFTTKDESKSDSTEMIADTSSDIETASNSNIDFKLFDYNKNINFTNDYSKEVRLPNKNGDSTFDYSHNQYFSFQSDPIHVNYNCYTVRNPISMQDLNPIYDGGQFHINHATAQPNLYNGSPVLDLINNARNELRDNNITSLDSLGFTEEQLRLDYLFGGKKDYAVTEYDPTNTILKYDENTKTYSYDSSQNAVDYSEDEKKFNVRNYNEYLYVYDKDNNYIDIGTSFMPFNHSTYNAEKERYLIDGNDCDYWFGMRMDLEFIQSADGKIQVTDESGNTSSKEMIFEFSGDDDVWVFIDDVLVLDLGGIHGQTKGSINFSTGVVEQIKDSEDQSGENKIEYNTTIKTRFTNAGKNPNGGWDSTGATFADYTSHKLSFFYLERGAGGSNCAISFNLPTVPKNSLTVAKQAVDSNENNVDKDDTVYTFRLKNSGGEVITNESAEGAYQRYVNGQLTDTTVDKDGIFELKNGESVYFKQLDSEKTYIIEELINQSYIKSTDVYVDNVEQVGYVVIGENQLSPAVSVKPATDSTRIVKFTNTIKSLDVTLKYYGRETVNGLPADLKDTPTTYKKTFIASDESSAKYFDGITYNDPIGQMIIDASTGLNYDSAIDGYHLWKSQTEAIGTSGIQQFLSSQEGNDPYLKTVKQKYNDSSQYQYHADRYGNPTNEKWVTYSSPTNQDIITDTPTTDNVSTVTIWLFNTPKQYTVTAYEGKSADSLELNSSTGNYVASQETPKTIYAYYNQRLGLEIDKDAEYSQATNHLNGYSLPGYVDTKLETQNSINKDNKNLKFAYWSFDENGNTVASTDILYNYRITQTTSLYAVYNESGTVKENAPGLTVYGNTPDVYFNENGVSLTRLSTIMNPYNCKDNDGDPNNGNIKNVAIIYIFDNNRQIVTDTAKLKMLQGKIQDYLNSNNVSSGSNQTITITDPSSKGKYFAYVVDGVVNSNESQSNQENKVLLTNKNRIEFTISFQTNALKSRTMLAFAAIKYGSSWTVSDNCVDYQFDTAGKLGTNI